jgi:hypothetical protein
MLQELAVEDAVRYDIMNIWGMEMENLPDSLIHRLMAELLTRTSSRYRTLMLAMLS